MQRHIKAVGICILVTGGMMIAIPAPGLTVTLTGEHMWLWTARAGQCAAVGVGGPRGGDAVFTLFTGYVPT